MGKAEVGTPKYIANKIKAKGLQKLRWYCQMCEKQCRDENGFKCHTMSESHQRQLLLFADNQGRFMNDFSRQFSREFLLLLKRQFGTKRVLANKVYQEYISDRKHLHMNATQWETLTDFVKWLGRESKCIADETEKGWFITYIDRDPETIKEQEKKEKKEKMAKDDEEEMMDFIQKQIKRDKHKNVPESKPTELMKSEDEKLSIKLNINAAAKPEKPTLLFQPSAFPSTSKEKILFKKPKEKAEKRPLSNLEAIRKEEEERKKRREERFKEEEERNVSKEEAWITEGIVVKVVTKLLGEEFYNKKGVIRKVIDKYGAVVKIFDSNKKVKVDQSHLQTVIPNIGKDLKILNGKYAGSVAELINVNIDKYSVNVKVKNPAEHTGKILNNLKYEIVSKIPDVH